MLLFIDVHLAMLNSQITVERKKLNYLKTVREIIIKHIVYLPERASLQR